MFGWFEKGFSMTDLPAMVKQVETEWDTHTENLKTEFEAVKGRLEALESQVFGVKPADVSRETQPTQPAQNQDQGVNHVE